MTTASPAIDGLDSIRTSSWTSSACQPGSSIERSLASSVVPTCRTKITRCPSADHEGSIYCGAAKRQFCVRDPRTRPGTHMSDLRLSHVCLPPVSCHPEKSAPRLCRMPRSATLPRFLARVGRPHPDRFPTVFDSWLIDQVCHSGSPKSLCASPRCPVPQVFARSHRNTTSEYRARRWIELLRQQTATAKNQRR